MEKRIKLFFIFITVFLLSYVITSEIRRYHRISFIKGDITDCPSFARERNTVTVKTVSVTDGYLVLYLDGKEIEAEEEGVFRFTMPDHEVNLKSSIIGFSNYETNKMEIKKRPVKIIYDRMWFYSLRAETEDTEMIDMLTKALVNIEYSDESVDYAVDDFTDRITFVYEDGTSDTFVFDGYCLYSSDEKAHYPVVSGLDELRSLLDYLVREDDQ